MTCLAVLESVRPVVETYEIAKFHGYETVTQTRFPGVLTVLGLAELQEVLLELAFAVLHVVVTVRFPESTIGTTDRT